MRVIIDGNSLLKMVIGNQKISDARYRLMKYILEIEVEDGVLLHNVITGELIFLTNEEKGVLNSLPIEFNQEIEQLISLYFLVPVEFNEARFVQGYRKILQQIEKNKKKSITKYTIFPTTCCNAHCFYCFESEFKKINMEEAMAIKVAEFIHQNVGDNKAEISWFGGEPTVAANRIDDICKLLKDLEVDFTSGMVSNGYLFDEELVAKAFSDWNLRSIQITLDGTEEIYNRTKQFNVLGSAYRRVLNNIKLLLESGISVTVLLNMDRHNYSDLFDLVDELSESFKEYSNFRVSSHILFNNEGYEKTYRTDKEEEELIKRNYSLGEHIRSVGLNGGVMGDTSTKRGLPQMRYLYCMANDAAAIVVGPNGDFYKCEHIEDSLTSSAGIEKGLFSDEEIDRWFIPLESNRCYDCALYPACFVPAGCQDHVKCYPIDSGFRIESYKMLVKEKYYGIIYKKGGEIDEKV